jgi:hypothetical protein
MARRTAALKPQLNQIRTWARDGRTDAWIAFQLGTTALTVQEFRSEHGLGRGGGNTAEEPVTPETVVQTISFDTPPPAPAPAAAAPGEDDAEEAAPTRTRRQRRSRTADAAATPAAETAAGVPADVEATSTTIIEGEPAERAKRRRRRGGRGGAGPAADVAAPAEDAAELPVAAEPARGTPRRKSRTPASYAGSVVAGAVLVLDPAITRSAAWRANWADAPGFDVVIEDDQIVLRRRTDG